MQNTFIGYGSMARVLAGRFKAAHDVTLAGHHPEKARAAAEELGVAAEADTAAAVAQAEVVVIATPAGAVFDAVDGAGGPSAFAGKVVVDINNPVPNHADGDFKLATFDDGPSLGEALQHRLPEAHVVKAFNTAQAKVWALDPITFDGRKFSVPVCGDSNDAKAEVIDLIELMGAQAWDVGGIRYAGQLEALAAMTIQLLFSGHDPHTVFNMIQPEQQPIG